MDVDIHQQENNKPFDQGQGKGQGHDDHAGEQEQEGDESESRGWWEQRTDSGDTQHTRHRDRDRNVDSNSSAATITANHNHNHKRLSIGDLVHHHNGHQDYSPSPRLVSSRPGSAAASASGSGSPILWPSTSTSTVTATATASQHSPVPPPLESRRAAPSKRPGPIPIAHSSSFPLSSSRVSAARHSPYPTSASTNSAVGLGIMGAGAAAADGGAPPLETPLPGGMGGLGSPSGSLSNRRNAPRPVFPSPKKESRSHSFNSPNGFSGSGQSAGMQTPADWYLKTPTALRTAHILSPVPIPGGGSGSRRPAPLGSAGAGVISASAPGAARRVHLTDVPKAKLVQTLNSKAGEYWFRPETSDCRIYVPMPRKKSADTDSPDSASSLRPTVHPPVVAAADEGRPNVVSAHGQASGFGRRGSEPGDQAKAQAQDVPVLVFPLHRDYLIIQSNLLRALLSSGSSLDVTLRTSPTRAVFPQSPAPGTPGSRSFPASRPDGASAPRTLKGARILPPSTPREGGGGGGAPAPISVYLPLPDPASFGVILHWLYFGDTATLERSLSRGSVSWQGIVKNIEYLSLDDSIKRVMGKWWRTWVKTDVGRVRGGTEGAAGVGRKPSRGGSSDGDADASDDGDSVDDGMQVDDNEDRADDAEGVSDMLKNL